MSEEQQPAITLTAAFVTDLAAAVGEYGEPVVHWAWNAFFTGLLPFAAAIRREQELEAMGQALGLTREQTMDGIRLMHALRESDNPHNAWLAGEIVLRTMPKEGVSNLVAAIGPTANKQEV